MQPNTCNLLADFSQNRSVETPLKPAPRSSNSSPPMKLGKLENTLRLPGIFLLLFGVLSGPPAWAQTHMHVVAGALNPAVGSQLCFVNVDAYLADSGYVFNMLPAYNPRITNGNVTGRWIITDRLPPVVGYYVGGPTFAAAANDGSDESPAAAGARIGLKIVAVDGPPGGHWSFWETSGDEEYGITITFSHASGTTNGTNTIILSENNGQPGADPYGHIHGRAFTADVPGLYTVWMQLVDVSRNGTGGGPLHAPSRLYRYYYQAGTTIARLARTNGNMVATFGTQPYSVVRSYSYFLEAQDALDPQAEWATVAGPVTGNNRLQTLSDPIVNAGRFYRLRVTSP